MEPVGTGGPPGFPPFNPAVLAAWLGAPVALLSEPPGRAHHGDRHGHRIGHGDEHPVHVTVWHRYDSDHPHDPPPATIAMVRTRLRQADGEARPAAARQVVVEAVADYQLAAAGRAGVPLATGSRPAELDEQLARMLTGWSWRDVMIGSAVGSVPIQWEHAPARDFATREEIIGCGGSLGNTIIAVVGPRALLGQIALTTVHPQ